MAQNQQLGTFGQVVSVNTASNTVTITSQIAVGNVSINSTGIAISGGSINNTNYPGTANNANNLGGVAASSYVNTAGSYTISGIHTYNANIIIGTTAGVSANGSFGTSGQVLVSNGSTVYWGTGTTGSNTQVQFNDSGVANASAGFIFDKASNTLTVSNTILTTIVNAASFSVGSSWTANSTKVVIAAGVALEANGGIGTAGQSLVSNGSSVYWTTAGATLNANNSDGTTYYIGLSSATSGSWTNAVVSTTGLSFVPSTGTLNVGNTVVATNFTGTSNNSNYLGGNSASTLISYSDTMAATAYSNAASYTDTKIGTANGAITGNAATAYTNAVSYVDGLKIDSVTNTSITLIPVANTVKNAFDRAIDANTRAASAQTAAASAYTNAVSYTDGKILTANAAITGNAATAYTNATTFAANATNISSGTVAEARLPYRMDQNVRTTDNITVGNMTVSGNLYVGSNVNIIGANNLSLIDNMIYLNANNTTANPDLGFAGNYNDGTYRHTGFFRDASDGIWKVFDSYTPEPDANVYIDTTNTSFHVANFQANTFYGGNTSTNWFTANTSGVFVNSTLIGNATGAYGKTESNLNVNNALTSNNSSNLGGTAAASYALKADVHYIGTTSIALNRSSLAQTLTGVSIDGSANNASNLGGTAAASYALKADTHYIGTTAIALNRSSASQALTGITSIDGQAATALTANNASNLGGVAAASYATLASPTFTGTVSVAQANVLNQTLTDATTIAWNTASGQVATVTIGASRTMGAPSNLKVGTYILHVIQGGSGSYGITWNSVFKWPAGVAPVLTTTVGARDVFSFISDGTNLYGSYLTDVK